jgi:hypothetical protein
MSGVEGALGAKFADAKEGSDSKVEGEEDESEKRHNLDSEASNHDVVSEFWVLIVVCLDRCDATACSLQGE